MNNALLAQAANEARGLAMDAVHKCSSGHLGLPLGAAEVGAVLFGEKLVCNPADPHWLGRDRFILSAGHGSMFLYSWLHLSGYAVSIDDVANFRVLHSMTPGHPEFRETPGVECTTGPLGQGVGNAVGYALSGKRAAARYNTSEHTLFDHHIIALAGDGCLQEGVAREAVAFAGHNRLDNLILIFDSNDVTLDAMAERTQSDNFVAEFEALGWDAVTIDGHDVAAIAAAIDEAKANNNGRPKIIISKTIIAKGITEVQGTAKGHGEGGAKFVDEAKKGLGLPSQSFYVSDEVKAYFADLKAQREAAAAAWQANYDAWAAANPELATEIRAAQDAGWSAEELLAAIPEFAADDKSATRVCGEKVINALAAKVPQLITGSADLFGSTKNYIKDGGDFSSAQPTGRNIWFGIREHAMGAICNGIAYDGLFHASCATFLVFADYCRPSIRLAALAGLPVTYIFTHDSVGVGEDGPTHQPVETVSGLRVIPNLDVIRPCDGEETAAAYAAALSRRDGPTLFALSRQNLPSQSGHASATERRQGTLKGGYVLVKETAELEAIVIATGSEVQWAVAAAEGRPGVRVVSMPCMERFERQEASYRESVLPTACPKRVAIEAGVSGLWWKFVGSQGTVIGIDRFGISAPGDIVFRELGITAEAVTAALA